ncbi:MAG: hypothetical protein AAB497_02445 [Patescibacteria group bacterium]
MDQNINAGAPSPEKGPIGAKISIIIVVLILAFGAYYFLKQVPVEEGLDTLLTPSEVQSDAAISNLSAQGTSTELSDIQKDLDATDLSNLDAGLSDIAI